MTRLERISGLCRGPIAFANGGRRRREHYTFVLRALIVAFLRIGAFGVALEEASAGHPETLYGKPLPYQKVDSVGPCTAVEVVGNRLYAIGQGRLDVLDITVTGHPKLLGTLVGLGTTRQLVVRDKIAYITARQDGLWLVDLSDETKPAILSHYDTVEMATGIWVAGSLAYVAQRIYGVEIVDVSNPRQARHVAMLKTGEAQSCWTRDAVLYVGDWAQRQLVTADITNPRRPVILAETPMDGYGDGGCLQGDYCFCATGHHSRASNKEAHSGNAHRGNYDKILESAGASDKEANFGHGHGMEVFDISKPAQPRFLSRVKFPSLFNGYPDLWSARISGHHCVVADTYNGVFVVDTRDVHRPAIVAHAQLPYDSKRKLCDPVGGVALANDVIYVAGVMTGLYVVSAPGMACPVTAEPDRPPVLPPLPETVREDPDFYIYRPEGQVHAVAVQGDIAWVACGAAGLEAVRLGEKPQRVAVHRTQEEVCYVSLAGNRLCTAEGKAGMGIYEIGAQGRLTELGRLTVPGQGVKQALAPAPGRWALVHCGSNAVQVVDLREPGRPTPLLTHREGSLLYSDHLVDRLIAGRYLVAYWYGFGPAWFDTQGLKPTFTGITPSTKRYGWWNGVCALGDQLLLIHDGKYVLLGPNERRNVGDLPAYGVDGVHLTGRPSVGGDVLAVASRQNREVWVLDIHDPAHPRLKHHYSLTGHPATCDFWQGRAVIPAGYQGLLVERAP